MTKLLKLSNSFIFINQYVPLWLTTSSLVLPMRNHTTPHYWFSFRFSPPQSKITTRFSSLVPFWLTLFLIHKLRNKHLPHHIALDNGITSPRWCHHLIQLLIQWSRSLWHLLSVHGRVAPTPNLQHGNHKIQTNKVINCDKKMPQIMKDASEFTEHCTTVDHIWQYATKPLRWMLRNWNISKKNNQSNTKTLWK